MEQSITPPLSQQPMPADAKKVFSGKVFDVYQWEQTLFNGKTATFEKLKRPDTVLIVPVTVDNKIIITQEEQPGKEPFTGFVGGRVERGENVIEAAKRELREETGYEAQSFELWEAVQPISKIDWSVYTLIAKGCRKVAEQNLEGGEKIELREVSFDEFIEIAGGEAFHEINATMKVLRAKLDPTKMTELKRLLS